VSLLTSNTHFPSAGLPLHLRLYTLSQNLLLSLFFPSPSLISHFHPPFFTCYSVFLLSSPPAFCPRLTSLLLVHPPSLSPLPFHRASRQLTLAVLLQTPVSGPARRRCATKQGGGTGTRGRGQTGWRREAGGERREAGGLPRSRRLSRRRRRRKKDTRQKVQNTCETQPRANRRRRRDTNTAESRHMARGGDESIQEEEEEEEMLGRESH